jgi:hypothetical protein
MDMKLTVLDPPREFEVGKAEIVKLRDCAHIQLEADELVTFVTQSGAEYDVTRKSWGFYATPSLNGRLTQFGWRALLAKSPGGRFYIFLVEAGKEAECERYLKIEEHAIVCWLDSDQELETLERKLKAS